MDARKVNRAILSNFTLNGKSDRYGSKNISNSKAKTSDFMLSNYQLGYDSLREDINTNLHIDREDSDSFDASDINNNVIAVNEINSKDATDVVRKKSIQKRNAKMTKDNREPATKMAGNDTEKNGDSEVSQNIGRNQQHNNTSVVPKHATDSIENRRNSTKDENTQGDKSTSDKRKKRRRRRRGRGRRRGARRRNDLSLWIDGRQVKLFSGKEILRVFVCLCLCV